jgi:hypothetical protein
MDSIGKRHKQLSKMRQEKIYSAWQPRPDFVPNGYDHNDVKRCLVRPLVRALLPRGDAALSKPELDLCVGIIDRVRSVDNAAQNRTGNGKGWTDRARRGNAEQR